MKRLKTLAMYLPQFHRLPENDEWWGEGFTEWTAVKTAEKLFVNHNQPREPLNDHYYDLMSKDTMQWQAELAEKYGIDGFCFYHYYFKNGRKILEKPAENLLKWKDIDMPFCFCWANQTWARTWSNIKEANSWSEKFENPEQMERPILLEQNYGGQEQWVKHFEYLLPFFEDQRYIRINNKPVFLFYKPEDIGQLGKMIACWQELGHERGLEGIYMIGVNTSYKLQGLDAILLQGPLAFMRPHIIGKMVSEKWDNGVRAYDYQSVWENGVEAEEVSGIKTFFGAFVDYDDTPRRGKLGMYMSGSAPQCFEKNLFQIAVKNMVLDNPFLFINAWNEWGEGNYLEPDKKYGYGYLDAVKHVMNQCNAEGFEPQIEWDKISRRKTVNIDEEKKALISELNKYRGYYKMLDRWLLLKEKGQGIESYFINKGYKRIVIYGFAALGQHVYEELKDGQTCVVGALDRRQGLKCEGLKIFTPEEKIPKCDAIVVTAVYDFDAIAQKLREKTDIPIVSLQDVIFYQ